MTKNFYEIAVRIQDASNPIAVTGELREAMMNALTHSSGHGYMKKDPAVLAIFFKLYDMLGAPSTKEMYNALKICETANEKGHYNDPHKNIGKFGAKRTVTRCRK